MIFSIRGRLLSSLLAATALLATGASLAIYQRAKSDINDLFDNEMKQMVFALGTHMSSHPEWSQEPLLRVEHDFVAQVWGADGKLIISSREGHGPDRPLPAGFSDLGAGDSGWRVFSAQTPEHVLQVAQPTAHRRQIAANIAFNAVVPAAALLPLGGVIIWLGIGYGLRPLRTITQEVRARDPQSLTPIAIARPPTEVAPLLSALNSLLSRLSHALRAERQFIADASHELRTPATALGLQLDLLEGATTPVERDEAMRDVRRGVDRMQRLIEQILTLARLDPDNPTVSDSIHLHECLLDVYSEFSPIAAEKAVSFELDVRDEAMIQGEASSLRALVRNLVDNAVRYTPDNGTVTMTLDRSADTAIIRISDTGPGIPEPVRGKVFARFFRADGGGDDEVGTGLGLAIARRAAERLGAVLKLQDRPNGDGLIAIIEFDLRDRSSPSLVQPAPYKIESRP